MWVSPQGNESSKNMGRGQFVLRHDLFATKQSEPVRLTAGNAMTQFGSDGSKLGLELGQKWLRRTTEQFFDGQDVESLVSGLDGKWSTNVNQQPCCFR